MKLAENTTDFVARGASAPSEFRISQSAKLMDMLSNKLYKYKIKAVIRELSTNAWDAHIMAGTTDRVPVVTIPTMNNCEFKIRDYGTGLTKHQIAGYTPEELEAMPAEVVEAMSDIEKYGLYNCYGASDKNHSNEYNGCMGIGSKAPFCYGDLFTVISFKDGMKYTFVCSKNERNVPSVVPIGEETTTEDNGLEIIVPVKRESISKFQSEAGNILKWFPKVFDIRGTSIDITKPEYEMTIGKCKLRKNFSVYSDTSNVIMGNVAYPIDSNMFKEVKKQRVKAGSDWYSDQERGTLQDVEDNTYKQLLKIGIDIYVDMAEVSMDMSREGLEYTEETIKVIKKYLNEVREYLVKDIATKISNCNNCWEAFLIKSDFKRYRYGFLADGLQFNGKKISSQLASLYTTKQISTKNGRNFKRRENIETVNISKDAFLLIADMDKGNYKAAHHFLGEEYDKDEQEKRVYLFTVDDAKAFASAHKISLDFFTKCSSINVPKVTRQYNRTKGKGHLLVPYCYSRRGGYGRNYRSRYWEEVDVDFTKGGVYVPINMWYCVGVGGWSRSINPQVILDKLELLQSLGVKVPEQIIGIKEAKAKKYERSAVWIHLGDWLRENISKLNEDTNSYAKVKELDRINYMSILDEADPNKLNDCQLKNLLLEIRKMQSLDIKKTESIIGLKLDYVKGYKKPTPNTTFADKVNAVVSKYPIFELIDTHYLSRKQDLLHQTINTFTSAISGK